MAAQTRPADLWLAVDDGSTDGTRELLDELAPSVPFMRVLSAPQVPRGASTDRLALALEARAFNWALAQAGADGFDFIGKLDGDMEIVPEHFERLLAAFQRDPRLGIAGCALAERRGGAWRVPITPPDFVHGAVKLYSRECLDRIGGIREQLGWDIVDEASARRHGFRTRSLPEIVGRHHRQSGSTQGRLRGHARAGASAWIAQYPSLWIMLRSFKVAAKPPRGLSGLAFFSGYLGAALAGSPRVDDPELRNFVRAELTERVRRFFGRDGSRRPVIHLAASGGGHLELLTWIDEALGDRPRVWVVSPGARATALIDRGADVRLIPNPGRRTLKFGANLRATLRIVLLDRPRVVVTSGAGSVVPFAVLSRLLGAKVVFIETMARVTNPSASGRVLSRIASSVLVQWPEMVDVYRGSTVCRPALVEEVAPPRRAGEGTFVAVGTHSEPFDRLLALVDDAIEQGLLPQPVVAQAGVSTYRPRNYETVPWFGPEEIEAAIERARIVVCHAGSGVISSALRAGRRPLVLPRLQRHREHFDDHQVQLAGRLAELGLVVQVRGELTADDVRQAEIRLPESDLTRELPSVEEALASALATVA